MSITISIDDNQDVRVTDEVIEAKPPDRVAFAAEGVITVTEALLGHFAGASLKPVRIDIAVDDSRTVETDLEDEALLRLDTVDVGVQPPDIEDLSPGTDAIRSSSETGTDSSETSPGAIAFTVEGAINDVPAETFAPISNGSPTIESITFAVDDPLRSDGGSADDVVFELTLFGYGITIHRDGTIDIGSGIEVPDIDIRR